MQTYEKHFTLVSNSRMLMLLPLADSLCFPLWFPDKLRIFWRSGLENYAAWPAGRKEGSEQAGHPLSEGDVLPIASLFMSIHIPPL